MINMHTFAALFLLAVSSASAQIAQETEVINAAFEDIAPCPCDLTGGSCDTNCCCDSDCTDDQKRTFEACIPFLPGGQDPETQHHRCTSTHQNKEDWFPLLCVQFEYNAFLGYFYDWQKKLANNTQTFLDRLSTVSYYWYREQDSRQVADLGVVAYKYGTRVKTKSETPSRFGTFTLPQPVLSGQCLDTAPVQYLKNLDHSCTFTLTTDLCSSSSILSRLFYVQNSSFTSSFSVLQEFNGINVAITNVIYKCASSAQASTYLRSTTPITVDSSATSDLRLDENCVGTCGTDLCVDLNTPDSTTPSTTVDDCTSQNVLVNFTPSYNSVSEICSNAVIDVEYTAQWAGSTIVRVDAVIIVGDIPVRSNNVPNVLSQRFKMTFLNNNITDAATDNFNNITGEPYTRSGKVGYDKGSEFFSGSMVYNTTTDPQQFLFVNSNASRQMAVFSPGPDGLCEGSGRRVLKFGEDITTSCTLQLNVANFTDCTALRKRMIYYLNSLMPADVLGRRGYNDQLNSAFWVPVLREDLTQGCTLSEYFPLGSSPVDRRAGICFNMTNTIQLDIFYAETGQSNSYPIYEVLGSKVSYQNTSWSVRCSNMAGGVCEGTDSQPFLLTSRVRFTQIPPQIPKPVSKYYESPREDNKQLCPGDRCWDNLMHPFTRRYNSESREYVFGMVSLSIIFFIGYGLVSRPFW
ncbi:tectonic-2-like [Mya arenaria]|uniref:tectonic-2-like n=1 Tax=Mya arenaria TaxID=6604 RepID=UPI0022DED21D|nr:tectonic-2-like [Mya arenaria]